MKDEYNSSPREKRYMIFTLLFACADPTADPELDLDEDGYTNQQEWDAGSDPNDANDIPYVGGWGKDFSCRFDIEPTGNEVGQIAEDFSLIDQYGDMVSLHDFCGRPVLLEFTAFT